MSEKDELLHALAAKRGPVMWRYLITGREVRRSDKGDNATFLHDATVDHRGRPYVKLTRARWRRVARRWALGVVPILLMIFSVVKRSLAWIGLPTGYLPGSYVLYGYLLAVCALGLIAGTLALARYLPARTTLSEHVRPAAQALCAVTSSTYRKRDAGKLIELPHGWPRSNPEDAVRVYMPRVLALDPGTQKRIVREVGARLGIPEAQGSWKIAGERAYVDIIPTPAPPRAVSLAEVRDAMLSAELHRPVAGVLPGHSQQTRRLLYADFQQESPHVAFSGPSGTGKSVFIKFLLCQRMRHGNGTIILDYKRWSHKWLHDMPQDRVQYLWRIKEIHEGLISIGEEMHRRIGCDKSELGTFREIDIVVEEINSLMRALTRYWKGKRKEIMRAAKQLEEIDPGSADPADLDPPLQSPAIAYLQEGVGMGRELQMHWWAAAQKLSAAVFGGNGGDIRESFQLRFIAKWNRKLWNMLNDGIPFQICPAGPRGVWGVAIGDDFHVVRVPFMTDSEARDWALSAGSHDLGPVLSAVRTADTRTVVTQQMSGQRTADRVIAVSGSGQAELLSGPLSGQLSYSNCPDTGPDMVRVRLSDAVDQLPADRSGQRLTLEGLRSAARRPGFPAPLEHAGAGAARTYSLAELAEWRLASTGQPGDDSGGYAESA